MKPIARRDSETGFRHVLGPLFGCFLFVPTSCGILTAATSEKSGFWEGFVFGGVLLGFACAFALGALIRKRR